MNDLIQKAIARGEISLPSPKNGRYRKLNPPAKVVDVLNIWIRQRSLEQICFEQGVSVETVKYWLYIRGIRKQMKQGTYKSNDSYQPTPGNGVAKQGEHSK